LGMVPHLNERLAAGSEEECMIMADLEVFTLPPQFHLDSWSGPGTLQGLYLDSR
jgi:hypothetical protein